MDSWKRWFTVSENPVQVPFNSAATLGDVRQMAVQINVARKKGEFDKTCGDMNPKERMLWWFDNVSSNKVLG